MKSNIPWETRKPNVEVKAPATIREQLGKLCERGVVISDVDKAYRALESVNYYRLAHYFAVFFDESGECYKEGTDFNDAVRLYEFDRKLRTELLVALEEIEVAFRACVSNYHAVKYGAAGYLNEDSFDRRHNHRGFINKITHMVDKNSDLSFVQHHNKKYGGAFPLWVMMEMFSFGMLVFFYQDLKLNDKKDIALHYYNLDCRLAENWLEKLAALRNHCAHYNRVYANPLGWELRKHTIATPREYEIGAAGTTLFDFVIIMKCLHKYAAEWGATFADILGGLFGVYSDVVDPKVLGFPEDWRKFIVS